MDLIVSTDETIAQTVQLGSVAHQGPHQGKVPALARWSPRGLEMNRRIAENAGRFEGAAAARGRPRPLIVLALLRRGYV
jgi:hypothetical protein